MPEGLEWLVDHAMSGSNAYARDPDEPPAQQLRWKRIIFPNGATRFYRRDDPKPKKKARKQGGMNAALAALHKPKKRP